MKERGILFSAPMVRALLAGTKTQTRRVCKRQPYPNGTWNVHLQDFQCHNDYLPPSAMLMDSVSNKYDYTTSDVEGWESECPYGQPGDHLWVRETWAKPAALDPGPTVYRADYPACVPPEYENVPAVDEITWKPSIHMFRRDSRILLEVISVRVERLNAISEADCWAEGIEACDGLLDDMKIIDAAKRMGRQMEDAAPTYAALWESINGAASWDANPWVWVVEFARITPSATNHSPATPA